MYSDVDAAQVSDHAVAAVVHVVVHVVGVVVVYAFAVVVYAVVAVYVAVVVVVYAVAVAGLQTKLRLSSYVAVDVLAFLQKINTCTNKRPRSTLSHFCISSSHRHLCVGERHHPKTYIHSS